MAKLSKSVFLYLGNNIIFDFAILICFTIDNNYKQIHAIIIDLIV